jgi:hypothetical protein
MANWAHAPSGIIDRTTHYTQKEGPDFYRLDEGGVLLDIDAVVLQNGTLIEDPTLKAAKAATRAEAESKRLERLSKILDAKSATTVAQLKACMLALIEHLGIESKP